MLSEGSPNQVRWVFLEINLTKNKKNIAYFVDFLYAQKLFFSSGKRAHDFSVTGNYFLI